MKKTLLFSLFMLFGMMAHAQIGGPGNPTTNLTVQRGLQVIQNTSNQTLTIIASSSATSVAIYNAQGEIIWTGTPGINTLDYSKWEEGTYYISVIYPNGYRETRMIKI